MKNTHPTYHFQHSGHDIYIIRDFPDTGRLCIYAPTLKLLASCLQEDFLFSNSKLIFESVLESQPKIAADFFSRLKLQKCPNRQRRKSNFFPLSVALTRNCSLACIYCHADAGYELDVSDDILMAALSYAVEQIEKESLSGLHVSFAVGGEPTFHWNKFKYFVDQVDDMAKSKKIDVHKAITTNGYYGMPTRDFISSHFDSVLLSFDGPQSIHDNLRPTKSGESSFDVILESCKYFANNAKDFAVRCTVVKSSLPYLKEIVSFFIDVAGLKENNDIVLEPMIAIGRGADSLSLQPDGLSFAQAFWRAHQYAKSRGYQVKSSAFNPTRLVTSFCHAMSAPSFAVTVDGKVTACERDCEGQDYSYGMIDKTTGRFILSEEAIQKNEKLASLPATCEDCICKWHCAGDCPDTRRFGYDRCEGNIFLLLSHLTELLKTN